MQEADLLLPVSSPILRLAVFHDGKRLDQFGKRLKHGSRVLVSVRGVSKKLLGVVRFKGNLPDLPGTFIIIIIIFC